MRLTRFPQRAAKASTHAALILACLTYFPAFAAPIPQPQIIPIWNDPAEDGVLYYHIPQILVTRSGVILACAEARHSHGDGVTVDIVLRRSVDGGFTWSKSLVIERARNRENYVLPVLIQERRSGRIFFHCALRDEGINDITTENFYRYSDDDGVAWSGRVDVTETLVAADQQLQQAIRENRAGREFTGETPELYGRKLFFAGPGRPIQLSAQHPTHPHRLAIPLLVIKDRNFPQRDRRGYGNALLVSDDAGESWHVAGIVPIGDIAASEPSLLELPDGLLLLNSRETPGRDFLAAPAHRTSSTSTDGGATWSRPVADASGIPAYHETHSGLLRLSDPRTDPAGLSRVLFSFPAGPKRTNGTVMLSYDDHRSWSTRKRLVAGEFGYSNMDVLPDGTIVLIHENGSGTSSETPSRVNLVRFSLDWLTDGNDPFAGSGTTTAPLRILPLGDSITRGSYIARYESGPRKGQAMSLANPRGGGWRKPLQDRLRAAGGRYDFVGDLTYQSHGLDGVIDPEFDPDHHGLAGFSNRQIMSGGVVPTLPDALAAMGVEEVVVPDLATVLHQHTPDVILLMSGTNGFDAQARDELIRLIGVTCPAHLFVATILQQRPPRTAPFLPSQRIAALMERADWEKVDEYNASFPSIVAAQQASGHRVTLVDMHRAIHPDTDLEPDGVHPNQAGMGRMAAAWFQALAAEGYVNRSPPPSRARLSTPP